MEAPGKPILTHSVYHVPGMDCPSESEMVKMACAGLPGIEHLEFDLHLREVHIWHTLQENSVTNILQPLGLGASLAYHGTPELPIKRTEVNNNRKLLWYVLLINFSFFAIESMAGWLAQSTGLVADSLDMLADAFVYGMALYVTGRNVKASRRVAFISGILQFTLALLGITEIIKRVVSAEVQPDHFTMIIVSMLALGANTASLLILKHTQGNHAHLKASMIFTSNDIIANLGVIAAGFFVLLTGNSWPDLLVGAIVFMLVLRGAWRILALARPGQ